MNSNNFFSAVPGFLNGVHNLQAALVGAAFVITLAGLIIHTVHAMIGRNLAGMFSSLVRLALIPIIILALQTWGDLLVCAVNGLVASAGGNENPGNVFQAYQAAIALKLGTAAAAANINQTNAPAAPVTTEGDTSGGFTQQPLNGVTLTHYAYPGDSSPDSNSAQGSGAFPFDSSPGSLIPMYSAALTASAAQAYNVQPGQSFTVTTTGGRNNELRIMRGLGDGKLILDKGQVILRGGLHIDQGLVVTSHAAQGKTVDQVIVSVPIESFSQTNEAQFYVSMSRAREAMHLFTDSKAALKEAVTKPSSRLSPLELILDQTNTARSQGESVYLRSRGAQQSRQREQEMVR